MAELAGAETIAANRFLYGKLQVALGPIKVYPAVAPRGAVMPYVLYQLIPQPDGMDTVALGGIRVLTRLQYLVKAVTATQAEAEPILKAIDAALQVTEGAASGYYVSDVGRNRPFELPTVEGDTLYWQTGGFYDLTVSAGL